MAESNFKKNTTTTHQRGHHDKVSSQTHHGDTTHDPKTTHKVSKNSHHQQKTISKGRTRTMKNKAAQTLIVIFTLACTIALTPTTKAGTRSVSFSGDTTTTVTSNLTARSFVVSTPQTLTFRSISPFFAEGQTNFNGVSTTESVTGPQKSVTGSTDVTFSTPTGTGFAQDSTTDYTSGTGMADFTCPSGTSFATERTKSGFTSV